MCSLYGYIFVYTYVCFFVYMADAMGIRVCVCMYNKFR